jgi:hypothetical protein
MALDSRAPRWSLGADRPMSNRLKDLRGLGRYARDLPAFLMDTMTPEQARHRIRVQLERREDGFLRLLRDGVYRNPGSPYLRLLEAAGVELADIAGLVRRHGLEGTLATLRDAGVYLSLDEFKGRRSIERGGLSLSVDDRDFDNPLVRGHLRSATGGSRGAARTVSTDLDLLAHDAAYHSLFIAMFGLFGRPFGLWRPIPPSRSGIKACLYQAKIGEPVARWFNPFRPQRDPESLMFSMLTRYTVSAGRRCGVRLASPEYCPPDQSWRVAGWLAALTRHGRPAVLDIQLGLGMRVCAAARHRGLDISGTFFRFGGEPYTEARAQLVARAGVQAVCHYSMAEASRLGIACGRPRAPDDVHLVTDKLAVLQREKVVDPAGLTVGALSYTTLLPTTPKLMLNVETDDYGILEHRRCGCPLDRLGLSLHLHHIRSYDKLTSEGNHFLGSDLIDLLDEVLPSRFGGDPGDYQLVEEEVDGLPKVGVLVRPNVGAVAEDDVIATVLSFLRSRRRNRMMADVWAAGDTIRVIRREPYLSPTAKILPLHILGAAGSATSRDESH